MSQSTEFVLASEDNLRWKLVRVDVDPGQLPKSGAARLVPIQEFIEAKAVVCARARAGVLELASDPEATPNELRLTRDNARLADLELEYLLKISKIRLPVTTRVQSLAAGALASTYREMKNLQAKLGRPVTAKDPRVTQADTGRIAFQRADKRRREEAPERPVVRDTSHISSADDFARALAEFAPR